MDSHCRIARRLACTIAAIACMQLACGGSSSSGSSSSAVTVNGVVVDYYGNPLSGISVIIPGISGARTTGTDGKFTFSNVTTPYDVAVLVPAGSSESNGNTVYVFHGLSIAAPNLPATDSSPAGSSATVNLTVSGVASTEDYFYAVLGSPDVGGDAEASGLSSPWSVNVPWSGPSTISGNLYVLEGAGNDPESFSTYGKVNVTLTNGGSVSATVTMNAVSTNNVQLVTTVPAAFALATNGDSYVDLAFDGADWFSSTLAYVTGPSTTVAVPAITGASVRVEPLAYPSGTNDGAYTFLCQDVPTSTANLTADLMAPPTSVVPADGATSFDPVTTALSWNAPVPASGHILYEVTMTLGTGSSRPLTVHSFGTSTSFQLPDPSLFGVSGVSLPSAAASRWSVEAISSTSIAGVEALLSGTSANTVFSTCDPAIAFANGATRTFTTP